MCSDWQSSGYLHIFMWVNVVENNNYANGVPVVSMTASEEHYLYFF